MFIQFRYQRRFLSVLIFIALSGIPAVFFINCSGGSVDDTEATVNSSSSGCNTHVSAALKDPQTIDQMVNLIRALPKPLTIDCFISALNKPLKVYAVDNTFSAQPSAGFDSPRIFIINNRLVMSVVPAGIGRSLLEVSEVVGPSMSVKGEIEFPVVAALSPDAVYTRIKESSIPGTSCRTCHSGEAPYSAITAGPAFVSRLLAPDPFKRVSQPYMLGEASRCNLQKDMYRCLMLRAIYIDGRASDIEFPMGQ